MTRQEARDLLNSAKEGGFVSLEQINEALRMTGDFSDAYSVNVERDLITWEIRARQLSRSWRNRSLP